MIYGTDFEVTLDEVMWEIMEAKEAADLGTCTVCGEPVYLSAGFNYDGETYNHNSCWLWAYLASLGKEEV